MKSFTFLALITLSSVAAAQPAEQMPQPPPPPEQMQQMPPQPQQPPPGSSRVTFMSTAALGWDVTVDQQPACATPCQIYVPPTRFVTLHSRERQPVRLDVGYISGGDVVVSAKPLEEGKYAAGVTFTALSGMGLVTGITLGAVGCSTDHSTMCKAGIITGLASGVGLYGSILLMKSAVPSFRIGRAQPYVATNQVGLAGQF